MTPQRQHKPGRPRRASASILLEKTIASGRVTAESLARQLGISPTTLADYQHGDRAIPLNHQARIALFVIAHAPELLREGNQLRHQVAAAIALQTNETVTHESPLR